MPHVHKCYVCSEVISQEAGSVESCLICIESDPDYCLRCFSHPVTPEEVRMVADIQKVIDDWHERNEALTQPPN